jgi:serine/threonine protein kinase
MTASDDWGRVKQLFQDALDVAPDDRLAYVRERAGDVLVLQEVMSLLETHPAPAGFLSTPPDSAQVRAVLAELQAGDELGPFRITGLIGVGGMGEVYRAWDTRLDRQVAIKLVPQVSTIDAAGRERFESEARAISRLTHPRISTLYDVGSASVGATTVQYLVMELVEGETLAARIKRGPVPVDQALAIAIDIAEALAAAHAAGVIHRDVKPANLHRGADGRWRILDLSVALSGRESPALRTLHAGTPSYMNPEQWGIDGGEREPADAGSDLFALGVTLYRWLTGGLPYGEIEPYQRAPFRRDPVRPSRRRPDVPIWLDYVVLKAVARDRNERFQTGEELAHALERGASRPLTAPQPTPLVTRDPAALWKIAFIVSLIFNALLVVWLFWLPS